MLYWRYKYFQMAVAIVDAAADFFNATKRIIFVSMFYGVVSLLFFGFYAASSVYLVGTNDLKITYNVHSGPCPKDFAANVICTQF